MKHPGFRALALGWCLCVLYVGYELARACSLALFASRAAGVNGAYTALSGFLLSIATLAMYGRGVELLGAKDTLLLSAGGCCALFLAFAGILSAYESDAIPWSFVASLFALRECYGSLIGTQIWALLSADLKKKGTEISRSWFCIIQGVSCICSAFAGMAAGSLASSGGQFKLLLAAALSLAIITVTVALAMEETFDEVGWDKSGDKDKLGDKDKRGAMPATAAGGGEGGLLNVLRSSASLFHRSPLLAALLAEAVVCQVLMATLNMSFNEAIRQSLGSQTPDTGARAAGLVGKSFAFIGLLSGVLQLLVMPWAMLRIDPSLLLSLLPLVVASGYLVTFMSPGFRSATAAFALTKILDYSVRGTALELVFQPMPDHERLLGKEAIATVGVRIGRTAAHVTLYCCSALMGSSAPQRSLMAVALAAAVLWAITLRRVQVLGKPRHISLRHSSQQTPSHHQQQQPQLLKWKQDPPQLKLPKQQKRTIAKLDIGIECRSKMPKVGASAAGYNGFSIVSEKGAFRRGMIVTRKLESIVFANDNGNGTLTAVALAGSSRSGRIDS